MFDPNQIAYFGETDARGKRVRFGIKAVDRTKHVYVIGKSGMGKSTLLENMAVQDIQNGNGFCFMDPHGGSAELLMSYIPEERKKDVLYIAPFDTDNPIGFNILEDIGADKRHLVVSGIMSVFKKLWVDAWSARMEYFLQNTLLALLEYPGATLLHVNRMYSDKDFRDDVISHITDPAIKAFWVDEWGNMTERFIAEATPAIQNKIGQFTANPVLRNILGQPKSTFDFRKLMDEKKIVIVNLSKGLIGEANADLLGSMIVTKLYLAAMSRADVGKFDIDALPNFYLYVDEFQSFSNDSFANILSEARKYKLNLTIAHQYIEQMEDPVRAAVFGNVGTMITFRVGAYDGEVLEKEFAPIFTQEDIVNLGRYQIYLKLMIDGVGSAPFSSTTLPPLPRPPVDLTNEVTQISRDKYSRNRTSVEDEVNEMVFVKKESKKKTGNNQGGGKQQGNYQGQKKGNQQNKNFGNKPQEPRKDFQKKEKPTPPPLVEVTEEENPFKKALQSSTFTKSMTDKVQEERNREKKKEQKKEVSLKDETKKYNKEKETKPERRNDLQAALAALSPKKKEEKKETSQKKKVEPQRKKQEEKLRTEGTSKVQNEVKEPVQTRTAKIPAHISDEQLEKLLKITDKDLEI